MGSDDFTLTGTAYLSLDISILGCYERLWKTKSKKKNAIRQDIFHCGWIENCMKIKINAPDKDAESKYDKTNADTYVNNFVMPYDQVTTRLLLTTKLL